MLTYRIPRGIPLVGRSFCDNCAKTIPWSKNIPVFYYFLSRAKSFCCGKPISARYPFIEALTAAAFVLTGWLYSVSGSVNGIGYKYVQALGILSLPFFLVIASGFIALIVMDFEFEVLPDEALLPLGIFVFLAILALPSPALLNHLLTGVLVFSFFLVIYLLTRGRGMGFGDVKMSFVLGLFLGFPEGISFLFLAFLTGALTGVVLLALQRAKLGKPVPFGPYLVSSAFASLFYGEIIFRYLWG